MIEVPAIRACLGNVRGASVHAFISELECRVVRSCRENKNNFGIGSKLEISRYLFNRHYESNNPLDTSPYPQSVKAGQPRSVILNRNSEVSRTRQTQWNARPTTITTDRKW